MTHATSTSFVTLDPTSGPMRERDERPLGRAVPALDGITIGLLSNGKDNAMELLASVYDELAHQFGLAGCVRIEKESVSVPPRPQDFQRLTRDTRAVITAIGD